MSTTLYNNVIATYPPIDKLVSETYLDRVLTVENIYPPEEDQGYTPKVVVTEKNGKIPFSYLNVTSKQLQEVSGEGSVVIIKPQNDTEQPLASLKGTIDRNILGTVNDNKGLLLALDTQGNLPNVLESSTTSLPNVYVKANSYGKIDPNWLNTTINKTNTVDIGSNSKVVYTRNDNNTIDPTLLNIQRKVVKITQSSTSTYILDEAPPSNRQNNFFIYLNGLLLAPIEDYSITNTIVSFVEPIKKDDVLQFVSIS